MSKAKKIKNQKKKSKPKSAIILPYQHLGVGGTRVKPACLSYAMLRRMSMVPAIAAIIHTRLNQVARFARRPRFEGDLGFKIGCKDPLQSLSKAAQKRAHELEELFLRTGTWDNPQRKDNFNRFLRRITRDTLTLDAMTWENVYNRMGDITDIYAVDASTIELVPIAPTSEAYQAPAYQSITNQGREEIAYVQRIDGQIIAEYTQYELAYGIRNPRTDMEFSEFGMSELEALVEIVTGIANGVRYNTTYFDYNSLPQGVMELIGKVEEEDFEAFQRHWKTMTEGAHGKWAVPVLGMEEGNGFKFTAFKSSNQDMQFNEFLEFMFNLAAAVYQIDPNEVGFKSWTSGNNMSQSDNTAEKIDSSKDKGFIPLMNFLSDSFNQHILDRLAPEFAFYWVGVDDESEERKAERLKQDLEMGLLTVAEVRKQRGLEVPTDAAWMQAPANPVLIQAYMAEKHQQPVGEDNQRMDKEEDMPKDEPKLQKSLEIDILWEEY